MSYRNFIITYNNPQVDVHQALELVKAAGYTYARGQLERGESGTPHLQFTFGGKRSRVAAIQKLFPGCHVEQAKDPFRAWEYCGKDDTRVEGPVEFGVPPARLNVKGSKKERNQMLLEKGAEAAVRDGDIGLMDYAKLKHNIELYKSVTIKLDELPQLDNEWIYGPPGTGKSRMARDQNPDHYDKPLNKWWDDYKGQSCVILDDFSKEHACLGPHLKRWADHYPFTAEVKGGATNLRPAKIVVTSNYAIEEIWQDFDTQTAIRRRFNVINKTF